jgi:hypothetical protein
MSKVLHGALAIPIILLAACDAAAPRIAADPADTVAYAMQSVRDVSERECRTSVTDSTKVPCVKVDITWPELTGDSARVGQARQFIRRLVSASFEDGSDLGTPDSVRGYIASVYRLMQESHKGGYATPWLLERHVTVACNDPRSFGIRLVSRQNTGQPHTVAATRYANFDARTGAALGLADYLKDGKEPAFRRTAARAYQASKDQKGSLGSAKVNIDSFPMPETVLACGDSLVLQYDAILMGPHRVLDAAVVLRRDELKGLLRD